MPRIDDDIKLQEVPLLDFKILLFFSDSNCCDLNEIII